MSNFSSKQKSSSFAAKMCRAMSPKRKRRRKTIHPCEQAFKYSIKQALILMELNQNKLLTIDFLINKKETSKAVNEADIVLQSMRLRKNRFRNNLDQYEAWLQYCRYLSRYINSPEEVGKNAKKYRLSLQKRDSYFR